MCGIAGFLTGASGGLARELAEVSSAMDVCLQHRGPDDHGVWIDEESAWRSRTGACLSSICLPRDISP